MSMTTWAEQEIKIACEREAPNRKEDEWDYGCACYESAYKAYKSLMEDGHSGYSIGVTKNILVRLIDGLPLTPIEDIPEIWNEVVGSFDDDAKMYQCSRMSSLFKTIHVDGSVTYSDVSRVNVVYEANPNISWTNGMARDIIDEMFPITMPYYPTTEGYVLHAEDFLVDPKNGDYDTIGYLYAIDPNGKRIEIDRYYAEKEEGFVEISREEYYERKAGAVNDPY